MDENALYQEIYGSYFFVTIKHLNINKSKISNTKLVNMCTYIVITVHLHIADDMSRLLFLHNVT